MVHVSSIFVIKILYRFSTNLMHIGRMAFCRIMNFFNYQHFKRNRGDIFKLKLWYVIIEAKIHGNNMVLIHKSQYLLIYKVCFDVQKVRVNFLCLAISVNRALDLGGCIGSLACMMWVRLTLVRQHDI